MNILYLGASNFVRALRAQGHTVVSAGFPETCDICIPHPLSALQLYKHVTQQGFVPDAVIQDDNGNLPCFPHIEALPCPSIFYSIDTFCNPWHIPYGYAFDYVLVAQKDYVPLFAQENIPSSWFPLFAHECRDINSQEFSTRQTPVIFVGTLKNPNLPHREPFLRAFQKKHPLIIEQGEYVPLYNNARIVLNASAALELNFRCFEAMACGCALLMEECANGLTDLFTVGEHILPLYERNNALQAAIIARTSLEQAETLERIAKQGYQEVLQKHMDTHRAASIVTLLEELLRTQAHTQRLTHLAQRKHFLSTAYAILMAELQKPALQKHAAYYQKLFESSVEAVSK